MSRSGRSDRYFLIDSLAVLGGLAGLALAAESTKHISTCSAIKAGAHHSAHVTASEFGHMTGACMGQSVGAGFVAYGVPTVIGIFAGILLAGVLLSLHRLATRARSHGQRS